MKELVLSETIHQQIFLIRGQKVMFDKDLGNLYVVETRVLVQAVKRNIRRFPGDFMFQLTWDEAAILKSQTVILRHGQHLKYRPYVFTEQGIAMLSSVLNSERAILVNVQIMRAFVKLREVLSTHKELAKKLGLLEKKVGKHDKKIRVIIQTIQEMIDAPPPVEAPPKRRIGFQRG